MLQLPEVKRALHAFPDEPLAVYRWNGRVGRIHELPAARKNKTVHPIAQIMARLAAEVEKTDDKLPQRIVIEQIAPAPMFQAPGIDNETVLERVRGWFDELRSKSVPEPINLTINNAPAVGGLQPSGGVEVHNYLDGKPIDDPEEDARKRALLVGDLSAILKSNQTTLTGELTEYLKANQAALTNELLDDLKHNQDVLAGDVLERLKKNVATQEQSAVIEKKTRTRGIMDAIRKLANGR